MEVHTNEFCCGCLSSDRKMKLVHDYWVDQDFHKILTEITVPASDAFTLWLCWECEARISSFLLFKTQVKTSSNILREYRKEENEVKLQSLTKLLICSQENIDINALEAPKLNLKESEAVELDVKEQKLNVYKDATDSKVKNEIETYSDDNSSLIDLRNEKQKVKDEQDTYSDENRSLIDIRNEKHVLLRTKKRLKKKEINGLVKKKKRDVFYEKIVLNSEEILNERTTLKLKEEFINSMFKCDKCILSFANNDDLKDHIQTKHVLNASHNKCSVCERTFATKLSLVAHSRSHSVRWRCATCEHCSVSERAARAHYRDKHKERGCPDMYELAEKAYQNYGEKLDLVDDIRPKSEEQIPCEYCDKSFRWKTSLRKHMETHRIEAGHKRKPYCETCRLSFTTSSNLRKHVKTSSKHQIKLKLRKLTEGVTAESPDPVQQAKELETIRSKINGQREQFQCPQCEKRFQWKGNLLRHLKSHAARANGDLVCEPCKRTFSSIATYKQHMKISRKHVSEEEFKFLCSDCGKRFSNKIKLRDHIDWEHLKNYTHICSECQKVFRCHTSLYLHRQVVHKLYNAKHLCDHCGKSFANKTKLRSHIVALHTRDSPYKCGSCGARFSWHSCLSRHVRRVHRAARNEPRDCRE